MKTLVVANQKGGVGKTTLSMHIALYAKKMGKKVCFIDLDSQGNSSSSLSKNIPQTSEKKASSLFVNGVGTVEEEFAIYMGDKDLVKIVESGVFADSLNKLKPHYDVCVIDTAPTASILQVAPLKICDYVLSPIELQAWSYDGTNPFLTMVQNIRRQSTNNKPVFLGLIPNRVVYSSKQQKADMKQFLANENFKNNLFGKGEFLIPNRSAYALAGAEGKAIWEYKNNSQARKEAVNMKKICQTALQTMKVLGGK